MRKFIPISLLSLALSLPAQNSNVIPLSSEPHHRLALHNDYVNVYEVEVAPHDTVVLHRHDYDAISVMLRDAHVSVYSPGKPKVDSSLVAGQVRLQPRGYVHSTSIEGTSEYHNVTIELLHPQSGERNLCAAVIAGQPTNCPETAGQKTRGNFAAPQFESDQTAVALVTLPPHQSFESPSDDPFMIVALNDIYVAGTELVAGKVLHAGDFVWITHGQLVGSIKNRSDDPSRFVAFTFPSNHSK